MSRKIIAILYILMVAPLAGCAWENLPEGGGEPDKIIEVTMRVGGAMRADLFYYIVFNLSGDPSRKPYSVFKGDDRGKYWNVYYMWGTPPYEDTGLYRGLGGKGVGGKELIDVFPTKREFLNELKTGTTQEGDTLKLRINLSAIDVTVDSLNMNMIVCNQAIDAESRVEYEYDPYVFDSFYARGITINLTTSTDYWDENMPAYEQEGIPNEYEESAPPEADIVYWRFQIVSR
jgi:hypothetical protein